MINVLSLFDGISCGRVALERAGVEVGRYVAFEIDQHAKNVSAWNYPDIEQRGTVEGADFTEFKGFDLVIGGFPCTDLSISKANREGLKGKHSRLFWEQVRAIKEVEPRFFLVENNYGMPKKDEAIITETLGVKPIYINSALVSAQNRKRLYWTNIPNVKPPKDRGVLLCDVLEEFPPLKYYLPSGVIQRPRGYCKGGVFTEKSPTITASSWQHNNHALHRVGDIPRGKVFNVNPSGKGQNGNVQGIGGKSFCLTTNKGEGPKASYRVGDLGKGSQATRIYSPSGKSVCLQSNAGGMGAKTGLYALALRTYPRTKKEGVERFKRPEVQMSGKSNTISTVTSDYMVIKRAGEGVPLFKVEGGFIHYKGREIPVKLEEGLYAIRKLTPVECERLQTLPDHYTDMVSDSQRYKQLGNGWTVEVIAHIFKNI